jgi:hypothetical protein
MKFLTRKGFLIEEQGMSYLADTDPDTALGPLRAAACTYRIALGPRAGQKVLRLQTVPTREPPPTPVRCVDEQGFSLHAEVCCAAHERHKLESQAQGCCLLGAPRTQRQVTLLDHPERAGQRT